MARPAIVFDRVWKKFRRGERHDSLRDCLPALARRAFSRSSDELTTEEFWALQDASFTVEAGEALGIIGPNGAGKSTTLKLLSRLLRPTRGRCEVRGQVGALIEIAAGFHPDLTGRENVYLQGAIVGMGRLEVARKFDEIVDFAGIADFIDTPVKRYSSGMQARLGFAVAAHLDPDVLLIDEVLAVGDLQFQQRCVERLAEFRRRGVAIAFVSHNLQAVASLCDRALLMRPRQTPLLGGVGEITAAYTSAAIHCDPRVTLGDVRLLSPSGERLSEAIRPGDVLRLAFDCQIHHDLPRCGVQLFVTRSDGHRVFDGLSFTDGLPPLFFRAGSVARCEVAFRANLLRGTYSVGISLVDQTRILDPVLLPGLSSFVVSERTRGGGCAELEPRYSISFSSASHRDDGTVREAAQLAR